MPSNRVTNMLEVNRKVLKRIEIRPLRSLQQLAMIERLDPDAVARAVKSFSQYLGGGKLIENHEGRICLTSLGREALRILEQFSTLAENQVHEVEKLRFAVSPDVPPSILALAISRFATATNHDVLPELLTTGEGMRDLVRSREVVIGVQLCRGDLEQADEVVAPPIPASMAVHSDHRLATAGQIDADHCNENDMVFLPPSMIPEAAELLVRIPQCNRIKVADAQLRRQLVCLNSGMAIEYDFPASGEMYRLLPVVGIKPASIGFILPKKRDDLSESALLMLETIRTAVRDLALPPLPEAFDESTGLPELQPLPEPVLA